MLFPYQPSLDNKPCKILCDAEVFSSGFLTLIQCDTLKPMDFYKLKVVLFSFQASWTDVKKTASQGLR